MSPAAMVALSIQQPWAWLITHGYKRIENRTWATTVRGLVGVHAGKTIDRAAIGWMRTTHPEVPLPDDFDLGGLVGEAHLTACVTASADPYFFGPYGFVLAGARVLPFRALRGHFGFFAVPHV